MKRQILIGILVLCGCAAASPAWAIYDEIVLPTPDGFWGFNINNPAASALKWSPTGGHDGGGYYYISNWGDEGLSDGDYQAARMYYTMPVLPYDERMYNIYAWNPTANSSQWHILNINSDGQDSAGVSPNITWPGQFGTNAQWIMYEADSGTIPQGGWVKLGPGPQTDANADGGQGVYFNPPDGYTNPTDVHAPKVYVKYQPWYNGDIAFSAIRIVEVPGDFVDGDFDRDDDVDGNDLLVWQRGDTSNLLTPAYLQLWKDTFPTSAVAASGAVPEPAAVIAAIEACVVGGVLHARTRRRHGRP